LIISPVTIFFIFSVLSDLLGWLFLPSLGFIFMAYQNKYASLEFGMYIG